MEKQPLPVLTKYGTSILIDQLKQYVKSSKQIFEFSTRNAFPAQGKVGNVYLDTTAHTIWVYDQDTGYVQFTESYLKNSDNVWINCGASNDAFIE